MNAPPKANVRTTSPDGAKPVPLLRNHHAKLEGSQDPAADRTQSRKVPFDFFGSTIDVARRLVGAFLVREPDDSENETRIVVRIVETEAYLPLVDPSCHAYRGPTKRNASAFGRRGTSYVYFIYGNHFCLNVATEPPGIGAAVLIRAAEPVSGIELMRDRRPQIEDARLASGPGNLCRALAIDRSLDGIDLVNGQIQIVIGKAPKRLFEGPRIGLAVAQDWPLRFFDADSPSVSAHRRGRPASRCVVRQR
jgi:DNA-3-methyladenine glycosylase